MPTFVAVLRGPDHIFEFVNEAHRNAFGDRGLVGSARADVFPELNDQGFAAAPRRAFDTGRNVFMQGKPARFDVLPDGRCRTRRLDISYEPLRDARGEVTGLYVHGRDVTDDGEPLLVKATSSGLDALTDSELLTLLLYNGTHDLDAAERSDQLLLRFGSLAGVLAASLPDLAKILPRHRLTTALSLPTSAAMHLKITREIGRRILFSRMAARPVLASSQTVRAYLRALLAAEAREQFIVLFLDKSLRLIICETMSEGTVDHAQVYHREVIRRALELSASALILVHNHPSGTGAFSTSDIITTSAILAGARAFEIELIDHLLIAGDDVISMVDTCGLPRHSS